MATWILKEVINGCVGSPIELNNDCKYEFGRKVGSFIRLGSTYASRHHCTIKIKNNAAFIIDHKTLNGTFIGVDKVPSGRDIPLKAGDCIGIGLPVSEFSTDPYYMICLTDVDPEVVEIPDTCEVDATVLYVDGKATQATKRTDKDCFLGKGFDSRMNDSVFRAPAPVTKSLSLSKTKSGFGNKQSQSNASKSICFEECTALAIDRNLAEIKMNKVKVEALDSLPSETDGLKNFPDFVNDSPNSSIKVESNANNGMEYSLCDDIIIVDSDEEDEMPCSQYFNSSKRETESDEVEYLGSFRKINDSEHNRFYGFEGLSDQDLEFLDEDPQDEEVESVLQERNVIGDEEVQGEAFAAGDRQGKDLSVHSQLSPETYLSRVDNENDLNSEPLSRNENVLEALMTQRECQVNLINIKEGPLKHLIDQVGIILTKPSTRNKSRNIEIPSTTTESHTPPSSSIADDKSILKSPTLLNNLDDNHSKKNRSKKSKKDAVIQSSSGSKIDKNSDYKEKHSFKRRSDSSSDEPMNKLSRVSKHISSSVKNRLSNNSLKPEKSTEKPASVNNIRKLIENGKKIERAISCSKTTTKPIKEQYNLRPSEKRKIRECRKKRLQEVALKEKMQKLSEEAPINTEEPKTSLADEPTKCFVKNTETNRGAILIEMLPQKPRSRSKNTDTVEEAAKYHTSNEPFLRKTRSVSKPIDVENTKENRSRNEYTEKPKKDEEPGARHRRKSLRNISKNNANILVTETKSNVERTKEKEKIYAPVKRKSILKTSESSSLRKKVSFPPKELLAAVQYYERDEINVGKTNRAKPVPTKTVYLKGSPKTFHSLIHIFCKWNPKWIEESMHTDVMPPLLQDEFPHPSPVISSYENYQEYQNTMLPLQVFELWDTIVREVNLAKQCFYVGGVRGSSEDTASLMLVVSAMTFIQNGTDMPKYGDLVIVKGTDKGHGHSRSAKTLSKTNVWLSFGYISNQPVKKPLQHSDELSLDIYNSLRSSGGIDLNKTGQIFTVYYQVMVRPKTIKFWRPGLEINIVTCANLLGDFKMLLTLENLIFSPLSPLVLNPCKFQPIETVSDFPFKQQQSLNNEQRNAVNYCTRMCLGSQPCIGLVHGPPGTGKSVVVTHLLLCILDELRKDKHKMRLLVCAPSNFAIDQLVSRLLVIRHRLNKNKFNMVRVGNNDMMSDEAKRISLKTISENMLDVVSNPLTAKAEIEKLAKREKYLKGLIESGTDKHTELQQEIYDIKRYSRDLELLAEGKADKRVRFKLLNRFESDVLYKSDIVATTLSSCVSHVVQSHLASKEAKPFGCCVIDEATQATELQTLLPTLLNIDKIVLVGDDKQLSPVVTSKRAKSDGLEMSLFERMLKCWKTGNYSQAPVFPLVRQYRMHPEIVRFPNEKFYSSELITEIPHLRVKCHLVPYLVFNHKFHQQPDGNSNLNEGEFVIKLVTALKEIEGTKGLTMGIITPYQAQRELLTKALRSKKAPKDISVMTVDSAQGQERDIIVFSCVRSHNIGFMSDGHRLNVALTRAKHAFYVVANFSSLRDNHLWKDLLNNAYSRKLVFEMRDLPTMSTIKTAVFKSY